MIKSFDGACPLSNKKAIIRIDYIPNFTFDSRTFEKGTCDCDLDSLCPHCDKCHIYGQAPNEISG